MGGKSSLRKPNLQWEIDNLTYALTQGDITMAQCTDQILQAISNHMPEKKVLDKKFAWSLKNDGYIEGFNEAIDLIQEAIGVKDNG